MIEIKKLTPRIRLLDLMAIMLNIFNIYSLVNLKDDKLSEIINKLKKSYALLELTAPDSSIKLKLDKLKYMQADAIQNIYFYLKGCTCVPNKKEAKAARKLIEVFWNDRNDKRYSVYSVKEDHIKIIMKYLFNDENKSYINAVNHLPKMINNLYEIHLGLEAINSQYQDVIINKEKKRSASSLKPKIIRILNDELLDYLNNIKLESNDYRKFVLLTKDFIKEMNTYTFNRVKDSRKKLSKNSTCNSCI